MSAAASHYSKYLQAGTQLNATYEVDEPLAAGGMGEVYRGHNIHTNEPVAIKVIKADFSEHDTAMALFRKEATALNSLHNEAIVRYHAFSVDRDLRRPYLAMEFVEGQSLADTAKRAPLSVDAVLLLAKRLALGLEAAHQRGIIHRDVSPDNIILPHDDVRQAKIIDFGIARSTRKSDGTVIGGGFAGKHNYVSPEQLGLFGGDVSGKSDMYSLALVLIEALRGSPLDMGGSQVEVIDKRRTVPNLAFIDARIRPLLESMLQPDPAARPASMQAVADWKEPPPGKTPMPKARRGASVAPAAAARAATPMPKPARRAAEAEPESRTGLYAGVAVALLAALGGGGYFVLGSHDTAKQQTTNDPPVPKPAPPKKAPDEEPEKTEPGNEKPVNDDQNKKADVKPIDSDPKPVIADPPPIEQKIAKLDPKPDPPKKDPGFKINDDDIKPVVTRTDEMIRYVRDNGNGECFGSYAVKLAENEATLQTYSLDIKAPETLLNGFKDTFKFDPSILTLMLTKAQCPFAAFISKAKIDGASKVKIELGAHQLKSGQYLTGTVEALRDKTVEIIYVSDDGIAQNITSLVRASVSKPFNMKVERSALNGAGEAKYQLVMGIVSAQPLAALKIAAPQPAEKLFSALTAELAAKGQPVGVSVEGFFLD